MAKKEAITRYHLIINKVRNNPASFREIQDYVEKHFEAEEMDLKFSKRTFHRDLAEIASLYNIEIKYNQSKQGYEIIHEDDSNSTHQLLEAFDVLNALNIQERVSDYIHFENRAPKGTENIHGILHAIKNHLELNFEYYSFWYNEPTFRTIQPLALKEFKNRWYIVSTDTKDKKVKTFALDRIKELLISSRKFNYPVGFNVQTKYKNCFGIISANSDQPEEVILSFHPNKGKFIKSLPLHHTQKVLVDNSKEFRVSLQVFITLDFKMEILSHGSEVKIISPERLRTELITELERALNNNKSIL